MKRKTYSREAIRSCKICVHYEQEALPPPYASDCKNRNKAWYQQRGYLPCPQYVEKPLTDDDYL